ncbi:MAG TPA: 16S rRNA (cytidine(1402)-2'-O)-methyltransferase [Candidatus Marinimicrobia bacterium]|nr:16S rRNA (cytidine(1402)-2'-O)-methyltransferase [Candidatus Neomarinimicrobiota bacterium]
MINERDAKASLSLSGEKLQIKSSVLYILGTPIGNLDDITLRALEILKAADAIVCEDTRITRRLLEKFKISNKKMIAHYKTQEARAIPEIISLLEQENTLVLVSDAGTPGISDPGHFLTCSILEAGYEVLPVPGVSAITTLLSVSHIPISEFVYYGFLPHKKGRLSKLRSIAAEKKPALLFESTHRIEKLLSELLQHCGERELLIGRELTKIHETIIRGNISFAIEWFKKRSMKGEFTLLIAPENEEK